MRRKWIAEFCPDMDYDDVWCLPVPARGRLTCRPGTGETTVGATVSRFRSAGKPFGEREHLKSPDGATVTMVGGATPAGRGGWMRDLTVSGNNDRDFHVIAGTGGTGQPGHGDRDNYPRAGREAVGEQPMQPLHGSWLTSTATAGAPSSSTARQKPGSGVNGQAR